MTMQYMIPIHPPPVRRAYALRAAQLVQDVWDTIQFRGLLRLLNPTARVRPGEDLNTMQLVIMIHVPNAEDDDQPGQIVPVVFCYRFVYPLVTSKEIATQIVKQALRECWQHELDESTSTEDGWLFGDPAKGHE